MTEKHPMPRQFPFIFCSDVTARREARPACRFLLWLAIALASPFINAAAAPRLNLISIVTDDQAQWSVGAYGNRDTRTPNLDRLAREGARFLNAFACTPVCSPSRAAFLTGRYGTQLGLTDYITLKEVKPGWAGAGIDDLAKGFAAKRLRDRIDWEVAPGRPVAVPSAQPRLRLLLRRATRGFKPKDPELEVGGKDVKVPGFSADIVMDAALGFVETNFAHPFALLVHFREPHLPYDPVSEADSSRLRTSTRRFRSSTA
jgi:uncharacterized sulfatase